MLAVDFVDRRCKRRNGDNDETDPRSWGSPGASGCPERSSATAAVHHSHLSIGRPGFWILSRYGDHPIAGILDEARATLGTARWIAGWITSSPRQHAAAFNVFSGARHEGDDVTTEMVKVDAEALDDPGPHAFAFANHAKKKVLSADVAVAVLQRLSKGQLQNPLSPRGERWRSAESCPGPPDQFLHAIPHRFQRDPVASEGLRGDPLTFVNEAQQNVLGTDKTVIEKPRFLLRQYEDAPEFDW